MPVFLLITGGTFVASYAFNTTVLAPNFEAHNFCDFHNIDVKIKHYGREIWRHCLLPV